MKENADNRQRRLLWGAIGICILLLVLLVMNAVLVFFITGNQSKQLANHISESVASEIEAVTAKAEYMLNNEAILVRDLLEKGASVEELRSFFQEESQKQAILTDGFCEKIFISKPGLSIIPGQDIPEDYDLSNRIWYQPTLDLGVGKNYFTSPYEDLFSGELCFTVSTLLEKNGYILGIDFSLADIQRYVICLEEETSGDVVIVNGDGTIIGSFSEHYLGKNVEKLGVKYKGVMQEITDQLAAGKESYRTGFGDERFFHSIGNDWYILLDINSFVLYRDSYISLARNSFLFLVLLVILFILFIFGIRNSSEERKLLESRANILDNLSDNLRSPLRSILRLSNPNLQEEYTPRRLEQIYGEADNLSAMLDNLFSYSALISTEERERKEKEQKENRSKAIDEASGEQGRRFNSTTILHLVIGIVTMVMVVTAVLVPFLYRRFVASQLEGEAADYIAQIGEWTRGKESVLSTFAFSLENQPELLADEAALKEYLIGMEQEDPDVFHTYIGSEVFDWNMMQSDEDEPLRNVIVAAYDWYQGANNSGNGTYLSGAYFDSREDVYCITISKCVRSKDGGVLAVVAIDYYIDSLTSVLEVEENASHYAFLVNQNGIVINHPNLDYRLLPGHSVNVSRIEYAESWKHPKKMTFFIDYDKSLKLCITSDSAFDFSVIVVESFFSLFGMNLGFELLLVAMFIVCIALIGRFLRSFLDWQEEGNKKLREAAEQANQAASAKTEFLAQMSHEIRTPINAVLGMNEMILRESNQREIRDYSSNIQTAGRTLLALINTILDFSKIEDGKMEIVPVNYQLRTMIEGIGEMTKQRAEKKGLNLQMDIDKELPSRLYGDDMRIHQVILNLMTNALKYTVSGTVTLSMRLLNMQDGKCTIYVSVKDTGIGIKPEDMENLFVSFKRLDQQKNHNIEGTGLGLSIVTNLLHMMGSELKVESVYGEGSNFYFELEQNIVDPSPLGDYRMENLPVEEETEDQYVLAPDAKILVVDDNEMNRMVCQNILRRNQIQVETASGGLECIERLESGEEYDLIFMDHMMPDPDGIRTLELIVEKDLLPPTVPVIVMTANAIAGAKESYLEAGFDDYMSKPIEIAGLEQMLLEYLPPEKVTLVSSSRVMVDEGNSSVELKNRSVEVEKELFLGSGKLLELCPFLNLEKGLENVAEDSGLYVNCFREIVRSGRAEELEAARQSEDWKTYHVSVHAVKGNLRLLGAMELGEQAYELELAAKNDEIETILAKHDGFIQELSDFIQKIASWLETA